MGGESAFRHGMEIPLYCLCDHRQAARGDVASICSVQETAHNSTACSVADCVEKVWL